MQQGFLFTTTATGDLEPKKAPAASHKDDPESSKAAEEHHTESGNRKRNADLVLELVKRHPGKTGNELFELAGAMEKMRLIDFYEVRRRLNDLHKVGAVKVGEQRKCSVKETLMQTWSAT